VDNAIRDAKAEFWRKHYQHQHKQANTLGLARSVEYSNERVQLQTYAHVLEGTGSLYGKSALDVGCGWGNLTLMLYAGGAQVTGADIVADTIEILSGRYAFITWQVLDVTDAQAVASLPAFDCVVANEVLEHVDFEPVVESLWSRVRPGGRLVATVPNSECPILREGLKRWNPEYLKHISPTQIQGVADTLHDVQDLQIRGLTFQEDQHFLPYTVSEWSGKVQGTPNRIVFVLQRCDEQRAGYCPPMSSSGYAE
jgi:2-polyprenyl-3-methyl-5-hydroxy-6-metoxy-1,4-benzoquinol methylase